MIVSLLKFTADRYSVARPDGQDIIQNRFPEGVLQMNGQTRIIQMRPRTNTH